MLMCNAQGPFADPSKVVVLKNKPLKPTMRQLEDFELARTAEWVNSKDCGSTLTVT